MLIFSTDDESLKAVCSLISRQKSEIKWSDFELEASAISQFDRVDSKLRLNLKSFFSAAISHMNLFATSCLISLSPFWKKRFNPTLSEGEEVNFVLSMFFFFYLIACNIFNAIDLYLLTLYAIDLYTIFGNFWLIKQWKGIRVPDLLKPEFSKLLCVAKNENSFAKLEKYYQIFSLDALK